MLINCTAQDDLGNCYDRAIRRKYSDSYSVNFRLIEYAQGNSGYLISHEVFLYVFDSMLMCFTMVAMSVFHPSKVLSESTRPHHSSRRSHSANAELLPTTER